MKRAPARRLRKGLITLLLAAAGLAGLAGLAAAVSPGDFDAGFGSGGKVVTQFGDGSSRSSSSEATAVQPDGKVLVAGYATDSSGRDEMLVVRLNGDGSLDGSFGSGGKATTQIGQGATPDSFAQAIAIQPDGRILIAGGATDVNGHNEVALARFNSDGSPDSSFGTSGKFHIQLGQGSTNGAPQSTAEAVTLQPDGKIVIGGEATDTNSTTAFLVARFLGPNGAPDALFGSSGAVKTQYAQSVSSPYSEADGVAVQPDGKIVAAGGTYDASDHAQVVIRRLNGSDGSPDTGFASNGAFMQPLGSGSFTATWASALALQPDGKILAGGEATSPSNNSLALAVRLGGDGSPDSGFGTGGQVVHQLDTGTDAQSRVMALAVQPNGRILLAGSASDANNNSGGLVARLRPDGSVDSSFGNAGRVVTALSNSSNPFTTFHGAALQPDGKLVASGYGNGVPTGGDVELARFIVDVAPSASFTTTPNPVQAGQSAAFDASGSTDSDGTIAGYAWDFGDGGSETQGPATSHTYAQPGTYTAKLTVRDDYGLSSSSSQSVTVNALVPAAAPVLPPPAITSFAISPRKFPAAKSGGSIARKTGARVSYRDSQAAVITFNVRRAMPGVRKGKRCIKPTSRTKGLRPCTRWVAVRGTFKRTDKVGANAFRFTGRIRGRKLAPGKYRLYATPRAHGTTGRAVRLSFQIIR